MYKIEQEIKEGIGKYKRLAVYALLIGAIFYVSYIFYFLFNHQKDVGYEGKVMAEITAVDIIFDKKIIEKIKSKDITGKEIPLVNQSRNPFETY